MVRVAEQFLLEPCALFIVLFFHKLNEALFPLLLYSSWLAGGIFTKSVTSSYLTALVWY